jgi:hypothetical protein
VFSVLISCFVYFCFVFDLSNYCLVCQLPVGWKRERGKRRTHPKGERAMNRDAGMNRVLNIHVYRVNYLRPSVFRDSVQKFQQGRLCGNAQLSPTRTSSEDENDGPVGPPKIPGFWFVQ